MARARLDIASGCFLLADVAAPSREPADALTLMRAIAASLGVSGASNSFSQSSFSFMR